MDDFVEEKKLWFKRKKFWKQFLTDTFAKMSQNSFFIFFVSEHSKHFFFIKNIAFFRRMQFFYVLPKHPLKLLWKVQYKIFCWGITQHKYYIYVVLFIELYINKDNDRPQVVPLLFCFLFLSIYSFIDGLWPSGDRFEKGYQKSTGLIWFTTDSNRQAGKT